MTRPRVAIRGGLFVLLSLVACASLALAAFNSPTSLVRLGADDQAAPAGLRLVVADGTGALAGVSVLPLDGDPSNAPVTDEFGFVELPGAAGLETLALQLVDASGNSWVLEQALPAGGLNDGVILLSGGEAKLVLAGTPEADSDDLVQRHLAGIPAEVQPVDESGDGMDTAAPSRRPARTGTTGSARFMRSSDAPGEDGDLGSSATTNGTGSGTGSGLSTWTPGNGFGTSVLAWTGETEPNNVAGAATCLTNTISAVDFGLTLTGQDLSSTTDVDFYCVTLTCGQNITVTVTPTGVSVLRPTVRLHYDNGVAGGALLAQFTPATTGAPAILTFPDNQAGTYFIQVSRSTSTGTAPFAYSLRVDTSAGTCFTDPGEPVWGTDETAAACTPILVPLAPAAATATRAITWTGLLSTSRDLDTYCVSLDCGERLSVTMTPGNATFVPSFKFIAPTLVSSSSNDYASVTGTAGQPLTRVIEPAIAGGLWAVQLTSSGLPKGPYTVSFSRSPGINCIDQYEPNDTQANCRPIAAGEIQQHVMFPASETDRACFDVPACGTLVTIQSRIPPGTWNVPPTDVAETTIAVFDPNGNPIRSQLSQGDISQAAVNFVATMPGTYTARVQGTRNEPPAVATNIITGRYDLVLTLVDATTPLVAPVAQTPLTPSSTQLDAQALADVANPTLVSPGPGAVDLPPSAGTASNLVVLPFTFNFYGVAKTQIRIASSGFASFTSTDSDGFNECLPNTFTPNDAIFAFWSSDEQRNNYAPDPTAFKPSTRRTYETVGPIGSREFIMTWYKRSASGGQQGNLSGDHSYRIRLHEGTDCIDIEYGEMQGNVGSTGKRSTVGIENATATRAKNYSCFEQKLEPGLQISYCPDGSGDYVETVTHAPRTTQNYPPPVTCEYDIATDSAPFVDISTTGTLVANWVFGSTPGNPDENYAPLNLPFAFPYHGVLETNAMVFVNGFLAFDVAPHVNANFRGNRCDQPETSKMDGKIMAFWDDLAFRVIGFSPNQTWDGGVFTQLDNAVPGDARFIIQWEKAGVGLNPTTPDKFTSFQAILHETGDIQFHYGNMGGATPYTHATGFSATVGLEDRTGLSGTNYWCNDDGSNFGDNRFQGPLVQDHRVTFTAAMPGPTFEWFDAATNDLLATGPQFITDAGTPCELRLDVTAHDPRQCCEHAISEFFTVNLLPDVMAALAPASPRSAASPSSACSLPNSRLLVVQCGGTDACDPDVMLAAHLVVVNHDVDAQGGCSARTELVPVACGEELDIRLVAAPCSTLPPAPPRQASSPHSGMQVITGESVTLVVTATDSSGLSNTATFNPTTDPNPACEQPLLDGSCCPVLAAPAPPRCPTSAPACAN